jgi:hypothetical protein
VDLYVPPAGDGTYSSLDHSMTADDGSYQLTLSDSNTLDALAAQNNGYVNFEGRSSVMHSRQPATSRRPM